MCPDAKRVGRLTEDDKRRKKIMKRETKCDEHSAIEDVIEYELSHADATSNEDAELLLSEDGEARRRFLKQALIAGGGLAAAKLLLSYFVDRHGLLHSIKPPTRCREVRLVEGQAWLLRLVGREDSRASGGYV